MKKKILSLTVAICLLFASMFSLSACKDGNDANVEEEEAKYTVTFTCDDNVSVASYTTQDYTKTPTACTYAYARSSETGKVDTTGNGQVNFKVILSNGYVVDTITITETEKYNNLKNSMETLQDNTYRITKITGDLNVSITTKKVDDITAHKATFSCDEHSKVYVAFDAQGAAYSRDGDTYALVSTDDGQINFIVEVDDGYEIDDVVVTGSYKNLKTAETENTEEEKKFEDNQYRVTKVKSDLTITVTTKLKEE